MLASYYNSSGGGGSGGSGVDDSHITSCSPDLSHPNMDVLSPAAKPFVSTSTARSQSNTPGLESSSGFNAATNPNNLFGSDLALYDSLANDADGLGDSIFNISPVHSSTNLAAPNRTYSISPMLDKIAGLNNNSAAGNN
eukprot:gene1197-1586_t